MEAFRASNFRSPNIRNSTPRQSLWRDPSRPFELTEMNGESVLNMDLTRKDDSPSDLWLTLKPDNMQKYWHAFSPSKQDKQFLQGIPDSGRFLGGGRHESEPSSASAAPQCLSPFGNRASREPFDNLDDLRSLLDTFAADGEQSPLLCVGDNNKGFGPSPSDYMGQRIGMGAGGPAFPAPGDTRFRTAMQKSKPDYPDRVNHNQTHNKRSHLLNHRRVNQSQHTGNQHQQQYFPTLKSIHPKARFVFLGNLPPIDESTLREAITKIDHSNAGLPIYVSTKYRRGHAFIEFPNESRARKFASLVEGRRNESLLDLGPGVNVNYIRAEVQNRVFDNDCTVVFSGLTPECTKADLFEDLVAFSPTWDLLPIRITRSGHASRALVTFPTMADAERAIRKFNGTNCFNSFGVQVEFEKEPPPQAASYDDRNHEERRARISHHTGGPTLGGKADQIYAVVREHSNGLLMSNLEKEFRSKYPGHTIPTGQNLLKFLVRLDKLLLINTLFGNNITVFYSQTPAFRMVIDILRSHPGGLHVNSFKCELEKSLGASLEHCSIVDFLKRWRVVQMDENDKNGPIVKLAPQNGATVFLGNLDVNCRKSDIQKGLEKLDPSWGKLSVRLNRGNGFVNAFVDFPTTEAASRCIATCNGSSAFGSIYVRAELENTCASRNSSAGTSPAGSPRASCVRFSSTIKLNGRIVSPDSGSKGSWSTVAASRAASGGQQNTTHRVKTPNRRPPGHSLTMTDKIYKLLIQNGGGLRLSLLPDKYQEMYGEQLAFSGNPLKLLVRMDRLLLLNSADKSSRDIMVFVTMMPAFRLVVDILKQYPEGVETKRFEKMLEDRLSVSLHGCDLEDFLKRWRFLTLKEEKRANQTRKFVHLRPQQLRSLHSGSTVFFGNLTKGVTAEDIYRDLGKVDPSWRSASVRLKAGKGFSYAFVDFATRAAAEKAVQFFDGKTAFNSKYVSADIESSVDSVKKGPKQVYTMFLGNLPESVTKNSIQKVLRQQKASWADLPIRLNLRSGWSHAFVDFNKNEDAQQAIRFLHNQAKLGSPRLRAELSKNSI